MNLNNETAEKLTEALNNFSKSMNEFLNTHPNGITLDAETFDIISSLNHNLKNK
ncbi:hypothetical protein [Winogradskyella damuponensis]|uniref:Uncharacterized protein n=1 Tax=Winogradskyella damuponensis TaxID=943939 RepID=A0ABP8D3U8_9FLAO